ncbi:MAG: binding-protein-dependent transport system inner rane component [Actinobacteria bacterium]|nr:binding-protein-dependent transport system inner rane component [Actinomycetota bacterium]
MTNPPGEDAFGEPAAAPPEAAAVTNAIVGKSPWQLFWRRFRRDRLALAGLVFLALLVLAALLAPVIASKVVGHGPNDLYIHEPVKMVNEFGLPLGPNGDFWFGADRSGRDLFVRVLYGARTSLLVGVVATGFAVLVGVILGMIAGYYGGWRDTLISRTTDIILSFPFLLFAIGIVTACSAATQGCFGGLVQPGLSVVIFVIALFSWPNICRVVRGNMLSLRELEFVDANRSLGAPNRSIIFRELLPNLVAPIIVYSTLLIPSNILFEAALSFLGLGVPQTVPSWGRQLSEAAQVFRVAWWMMLFPGLFLFATTLSFNLVGDGLRDALDPRTGR